MNSGWSGFVLGCPRMLQNRYKAAVMLRMRRLRAGRGVAGKIFEKKVVVIFGRKGWGVVYLHPLSGTPGGREKRSFT